MAENSKTKTWKSGRDVLKSLGGKVSASLRKISIATEDSLPEPDRKRSSSGSKRLLPRLSSFVNIGRDSRSRSSSVPDEADESADRVNSPLARRSTRMLLKTELTDLDRSLRAMRVSRPTFKLEELKVRVLLLITK